MEIYTSPSDPGLEFPIPERDLLAGSFASSDRLGLRRLTSFAFYASIAAHVLIGFFVLHHELQRPRVPDVGFRDGKPIQILSPLGPVRSVEQHSAWSARRGGALETVDVALVDAPRTVVDTPGPSTKKRAPATKKKDQANLPVAKQEGDAGDSPIRVHLREDWSVEPSSPMVAFSDRFNPIRVIVPEYPEVALQQDIEGLVTLEADIGLDGSVTNVHVVGAENGSLALSASQALLQWRFHPLVVHDEGRSFKIVVPFRFRISRSS